MFGSMMYMSCVILHCDTVCLFLQCVATKPDGSPAPRELVTLKVSDDSKGSMSAVTYNYTTDANGQFYFMIAPFQPSNQAITIQVRITYVVMSLQKHSGCSIRPSREDPCSNPVLWCRNLGMSTHSSMNENLAIYSGGCLCMNSHIKGSKAGCSREKSKVVFD